MTAGPAHKPSGREIEAKFCVRSLGHLQQRLEEMGAGLIEPRVLEINFRFDDPQRSLRAQGRVLRLRKDAGMWLTYKGPSEPGGALTDRIELEVAISDIDIAQGILEALGFIQTAIYEKYRTVYEVEGCEIMVDVLPYGEFVEIEGPDAQSIHRLAARLGLRWEAIVRTSYLALWERYCSGRSLPPGPVTFEALRGRTVGPEELGIEYAD